MKVKAELNKLLEVVQSLEKAKVRGKTTLKDTQYHFFCWKHPSVYTDLELVK